VTSRGHSTEAAAQYDNSVYHVFHRGIWKTLIRQTQYEGIAASIELAQRGQ
jgi:hypothetical protein